MGADCAMGQGMMAAMGLFWLALIALVGWGLYRRYVATVGSRRGSMRSAAGFSVPDLVSL